MVPHPAPAAPAAESSKGSSSSSNPGDRPQVPHKLSSLVRLSKDEIEEAQRTTDLWIKVVEKSLVPPVDFKEHKGRYGKVCVIGGSPEFTGAPYFVASAALRMGADLATIITTPSAAVAIKSYSPELLVYPILPCRSGAPPKMKEGDGPSEDELDLARLRLHAEPLLRKADVIVIGPGLGGSSTLRPHDDEGLRHQQQQQQQQQQLLQQQEQKQQQLDKGGSRGKFSHMIKDAMEDVQKAVRGSASSLPSEKAAAALDVTDPLGIDPAATRAAIREAEAAAAFTQRAAMMLLRLTMLLRKPVVIDADMLRMLCIPSYEHLLSLFKGYSQAILTPNAYEMELLLRALRKKHNMPLQGGSHPPAKSQLHSLLPESLRSEMLVERVAEAAALLGGPCIFAKGRVDVLGAHQGPPSPGLEAHEDVAMAVVGLDKRFFGAPKRSGGQGDVLCGVLAQAFVWAERAKAVDGFKGVAAEAERLSFSFPLREKGAAVPLLLMHAASAVTREAAALAFRQYGRSMTALNLIEKLNSAAALVFPSGWLAQSNL